MKWFSSFVQIRLFKSGLYLTIAFLLFSITARAQNTEIEHLTTEDGLLSGKFYIILIILVLAVIIYGFYYCRIHKLDQQKLIQENIVNQRIKEAEEKNSMLMLEVEEYNEMNSLLEDRQQHIEEQEEQLQTINEHLSEMNDMLVEKQEIVIKQAEILAKTNMDLEESNSKLILLNATKDKLFSIIAHDLKNPFGSILNFSEILHKKFPDLEDEKKTKFIQAIHDSSHSIYDLLENLLEWARTQTGNMPCNPELFNINDLVKSNYLLVKHQMEEKEILFSHHSVDHVFVLADRNMINTVLRNLLGNAVKYTEKGSIAVEIKRKGSFAAIAITDSGKGISESKMTTIFEIEQGKSTSGTRNEHGSGLGLLICKDFVQINKGEISVKSIVGQGTTFTFTLPLDPSNLTT